MRAAGFTPFLAPIAHLPSVLQVLDGDSQRLKKFKLRIEDPPRRKHMVFLGGSVLADIMREREEFWMSKAQYDEDGAVKLLSKNVQTR